MRDLRAARELGIVNKVGWGGMAFVLPRSQFREFSQRDETSHPGVYVIAGSGSEGVTISSSISEMDRAAADGVLKELLLYWHVLGFRAFEQPTGKPAASSQKLFHRRGDKATDQGFESPSGFTVLGGAKARHEFADSTPDDWVDASTQLVRQGVFVECP